MVSMLMYLLTTKVSNYVFKKNDRNLRQYRWLELLNNYDKSVLYRPGKTNMTVDALSLVFMSSVAHV